MTIGSFYVGGKSIAATPKVFADQHGSSEAFGSSPQESKRTSSTIDGFCDVGEVARETTGKGTFIRLELKGSRLLSYRPTRRGRTEVTGLIARS